ncbi:cytochrome P450 [Fodinicola acaciae]|uniref:cytochrome P450 n=1 Tax=Fodinicola acaciae TaxID=2681555 RepID=UPI001C9E5339|nr:cytochrome P450 [Fodinicola acaciae]
MTTAESLPQLPFQQDHILQVPPDYLRLLRDERPITRIRSAVGDEVWLATRYADVRALLADPRLGRSHPEPENAPRFTGSVFLGGPEGSYDTEKQEHTRLRRVLTPSFSARRMTALRPRVRGLANELLDQIEAEGPPADLHERLAFTLPVLVICELLGVPAGERARFRTWSTKMASLTDVNLAVEAYVEFAAYMRQLVEVKRAEPAEDVISDLIAADEQWHFGIDEITRLSVALLFAGHETTMTRIDLGTVLLLSNPDQMAALRADESLVRGAVEEILRMTMGGQTGVPRYAHEDIEIGGVTIRAGDGVVLNTDVSSRDERVFAEPDRFDITRAAGTPHLAFGHGAHFCIGASLARIELQEVFSLLLRRFPSLRLAVPVSELRPRTGTITAGLRELPVAW